MERKTELENDKLLKRPIGIIGADEFEVHLLKEKAGAAVLETIAGMDFCGGQIGGSPVVIAQCGIGKVNAAICAQLLISRFGVSRIINTGVAGSLNNAINIGDLVISTDAVQHDFDICTLGYQWGEIPYLGTVAFRADEELHALTVEAAKRCAPELSVFEGRICTGDQFIDSREKKELILSRFGGLCCEMEGAAVAEVCFLNAVPWVVIRAISDKADESVKVDYRSFAEKAARDCVGIVSDVLERLAAE